MRRDMVSSAFPEIVEKALAFYHANQAIRRSSPNAGKQHVKQAPFLKVVKGKPYVPAVKKEIALCRQWQANGTCAYGAACKFRHAIHSAGVLHTDVFETFNIIKQVTKQTERLQIK